MWLRCECSNWDKSARPNNLHQANHVVYLISRVITSYEAMLTFCWFRSLFRGFCVAIRLSSTALWGCVWTLFYLSLTTTAHRVIDWPHGSTRRHSYRCKMIPINNYIEWVSMCVRDLVRASGAFGSWNPLTPTLTFSRPSTDLLIRFTGTGWVYSSSSRWFCSSLKF